MLFSLQNSHAYEMFSFPITLLKQNLFSIPMTYKLTSWMNINFKYEHIFLFIYLYIIYVKKSYNLKQWFASTGGGL